MMTQLANWLALVTLVTSAPANPAIEPPSGAIQSDSTYRVVFLRAAPGRLDDLIDAYRQRIVVLQNAGDEAPLFLRHSQGDHWDLMLVFPLVSMEHYFSEARQAALAAAGGRAAEFEDALRPLVAWREELFVGGPPLDTLRARDRNAGFYHFETFRAVPGRYHDLVAQRQMENSYYQRTSRDGNLVFTRIAGAAWDVFTLGFYRDLAHFAETPDLPDEAFEAAAVAAGFDSRGAIGTYLRELISRHQDTLAGRVALQ